MTETPHKDPLMTAAAAVLCLLALSIFVSQSGISIMGPLGAVLLGAGWYRARATAPRVPLSVLAGVGLVLVSFAVSVFVSSDKDDAVGELTQQWGLILMLALAAAPLGRRRRIQVLTVFLVAGLLASGLGIYQRVIEDYRAHGFTNPNHFAGIMGLAFISSACMAMFASVRHKLWWTGLIISTAIAEMVAVIFAMTRGVWLGSLMALCFVGAVALPARRLIIIICAAALVVAAIFVSSPDMQIRASSISNYYKETLSGRSTFGDRLFDWQGGFMMFGESPLLGAGSGDFREELDRYVAEGRLPDFDKATRVQAHNLFVQTIATQGVLGITALIVLLLGLVWWGTVLIKSGRQVEGSIIAACVLFVIFWGFSESNLSISKVQAAFCFIIGMAGGFALDSEEKASS